MIILLLITGLLLDGLLTNFIPNISFFLPLLTITNIFLIYEYYKKHEKTYFIILSILGLLYDLLYTNLLFFHMIIFLCLGLFTKQIYKYFKVTKLKLFLCIPLLIVFFELLTATLLVLFQVINFDIQRIVYKITHSILLNIIYAQLIFISFERIKKA